MDRSARMDPGPPHARRRALYLAGLALIVLAVALRWTLAPTAAALPADGAGPGPAAGAVAAPERLPATAAEAAAQQAAANAAAARAGVVDATNAANSGANAGNAGNAANAAGAAPAASGGNTAGADSAGRAPAAIAQRPDYVSALEWQVLQALAARSPDPARELGHLVAKLRFSKQLDLWRAGGPGRGDLAARLLADLPARVAAGDIDRAAALALQGELLALLEPDPAARDARAQAEAARLRPRTLQEVP